MYGLQKGCKLPLNWFLSCSDIRGRGPAWHRGNTCSPLPTAVGLNHRYNIHRARPSKERLMIVAWQRILHKRLNISCLWLAKKRPNLASAQLLCSRLGLQEHGLSVFISMDRSSMLPKCSRKTFSSVALQGTKMLLRNVNCTTQKMTSLLLLSTFKSLHSWWRLTKFSIKVDRVKFYFCRRQMCIRNSFKKGHSLPFFHLRFFSLKK